MGNPKKQSKPFVPNHIGTQPREAGGNNGKQMQDKSGKHPQVIQTKGEWIKSRWIQRLFIIWILPWINKRKDCSK